MKQRKYNPFKMNSKITHVSFRLLTSLLFLFYSAFLFAEGTEQLDPSATDYTKLLTNDPAYGSFAMYDGPIDSRLNINISDPNTELVYLGFSRGATENFDLNDNYLGDTYLTDYYFRIVAPDGTVVFGPTLVNAASANLASWTGAHSGPAPISGPGGYTPFTFDPSGLASGDYYVEFSLNQNTVSNAPIDIPFFDITVAKNGAPVLGRLWSYNWAFKTTPTMGSTTSTYGNYDRAFNGAVYAYTTDGFVSKLDFANSGFRAWMFNVSMNDTGPGILGEVTADRRSFPSIDGTDPDFKIFINEPDELVYPSGTVGLLLADPEVNICNSGEPCIWIETNLEGQIEILVDLEQSNGIGIYNVGTLDVLLSITIEADSTEVAPFRRCVQWNGLDGFSQSVDLTSNVDVLAKFQQGVTHFTAYDAKFVENGFTIEVVRPATAQFNDLLYYDDSNLPVTSGNGSFQTRLNGCTFPCHSWSNVNYGQGNSLNTWWFAHTGLVQNLHIPSCVPTAIQDTVEMETNTMKVIDVLSNDLGTPLVPSTVSVNSPPINGVVSVDTNSGEITYNAPSGFIGEDRFWYEVCNSNGFCDDTWVVITVVAPLPVELNSFEVVKNNCELELYWTTETEENVSRFEIERSLDGRNFSKINSVQSMLNERGNSYFFLDSPTPGRYYYRLKSVDFDFRYSYSNVVQVTTHCVSEAQTISVYPNPIYQEKGGELTIVCISQRENPVFELINLNGKIVKSKQVLTDKGWVRTSFDLSDIPAGAYFLRSVQIGLEYTQRILKIE